MLSFPPNVTTVLVQVGAFLEPTLPPVGAFHVASLIVEPVSKTRRVLSQKCEDEEQRRNESFCSSRVVILGAAVSNVSTVGTMHLYNWGGVASSLSVVTPVVAQSRYGKSPSTTSVMPWNRNGHRHMQNERRAYEHVPVLSLGSLLDAIPQQLRISDMLLDMQGHDLTAIGSCIAGGQLRRVQTLTHECWGDDTQPFYQDVHNDCKSWSELMTEQGFVMRRKHRAWGDFKYNLQEYDQTWQNTRT